MKFFSAILSLGLLFASGQLPAALAATPDELYIDAYRLIQEGDRYSNAGQRDAAREQYKQAQANLQKLQRSYPTYNKAAVEFRLNYIAPRLVPDPEPTVPAPETAPVAQPTVQPPPTQPAPATAHLEEIADLQRRLSQLQADHQLLQEKLKEALSAQPAAIDPQELAKAQDRITQLEKEKELLRANLAQAEAKQPNAADSAMLNQVRGELESTKSKLAEAVAAVAALTQEKQDLERTLAAAKAAPQPLPAPAEDQSARVKQLESEREALLRQLTQSSRDLQEARQNARPAQPDTSSTDELARLRARLEVLEARKVPYTKEELALLEKAVALPKPASPAPVATETRRTVRELPAGAGLLVAEAQRLFTARRFDEAEAKYLEVLKMDPENPVTLANVAAIQLEMGKLAEADGNLTKAMAASPNDPYPVLLMGMVRLREEKYDPAFDLLSRCAQMDPKNAEAQNYLGVTLTQLGQREAAETALRKAITLRPNYAGAHHNLAFVYATAKPPSLELAKFHYNKALAMGQPRNPDLEKELKITP